MLFENRTEAGTALASKLTKYRNQPDVRVLALPRGGVPVALEVARALHVPMDVFIVRKLGLPGHPELAMGAIATGGVRVLNSSLVEALGIPEATIEAIAAQEQKELERRERAYRGDPDQVLQQELCDHGDFPLRRGMHDRAIFGKLAAPGLTLQGRVQRTPSDDLVDPCSLARGQRGQRRRRGRPGVVGIIVIGHVGRLGRAGVRRAHRGRRGNTGNTHRKILKITAADSDRAKDNAS